MCKLRAIFSVNKAQIICHRIVKYATSRNHISILLINFSVVNHENKIVFYRLQFFFVLFYIFYGYISIRKKNARNKNEWVDAIWVSNLCEAVCKRHTKLLDNIQNVPKNYYMLDSASRNGTAYTCYWEDEQSRLEKYSIFHFVLFCTLYTVHRTYRIPFYMYSCITIDRPTILIVQLSHHPIYSL